MYTPPIRRLRVVFMGTPDFSVASLEGLHARHDVVCVYSQPPRPSGRGHKETKGQVHQLADRFGIPVRTPTSLKNAEEQQAFAALLPDIAVVAAYGLILPPPILTAPTLGCINVHASLLPRWRGAAPIHRAVMAGDLETGITIMQMDAGLDTGPMLLRQVVPIPPRATTGALHDVLATLGARLVLEAVESLADGRLVPEPQPVDGTTYAAKLTRDGCRIHWSDNADALARLVRGCSPSPGAWFEHQGLRIKILDAEASNLTGEPGVVVDDLPTVTCGSGALRLLTIQRPGRGPMPAKAFLRGFPLPIGTQLA